MAIPGPVFTSRRVSTETGDHSFSSMVYCLRTQLCHPRQNSLAITPSMAKWVLVKKNLSVVVKTNRHETSAGGRIVSVPASSLNCRQFLYATKVNCSFVFIRTCSFSFLSCSMWNCECVEAIPAILAASCNYCIIHQRATAHFSQKVKTDMRDLIDVYKLVIWKENIERTSSVL